MKMSLEGVDQQFEASEVPQACTLPLFSLSTQAGAPFLCEGKGGI